MRISHWERSVIDEIAAQLPDHPHEITVAVPAGRAGTARRRLNRIAAIMERDGYTLHIVDPVDDRADGRWSTAHFRNPAHAPPPGGKS